MESLVEIQMVILVKLNIVFCKPTNMIKLLVIFFTKINHFKHVSGIHWNSSRITILGTKVNWGLALSIQDIYWMNKITLKRSPVWKSNGRSIYILCSQDTSDGLSNSYLKKILIKVFLPKEYLESSCKRFCKISERIRCGKGGERIYIRIYIYIYIYIYICIYSYFYIIYIYIYACMLICGCVFVNICIST